MKKIAFSPPLTIDGEGAKVCALILTLLLTLLACDNDPAQPVARATATSDPTLRGRIAFSKVENETMGADLFVINADGSGEVRVTSGAKVQGEVAWSPDGSKIVFAGLNAAGKLQVNVVSLMPGQTPQTTNLSKSDSDDTFPAWSPDGSQLVFASKRGGSYQVYTMNADGSNVRQLTKDYGYAAWPAWSPDGKLLAFCAGSTEDGPRELYTMRPDGSSVKQLTSYNTVLARPRWSPDSQRLVFSYVRAGLQPVPKVYLINADGSKQRAITDGESLDVNPLWSPDGKQVIFYSNAGGGAINNVFTGTSDQPGTHELTSKGGYYPTYSPNGSHIVYTAKVNGVGQLFVMQADSSRQRQLTFSLGSHEYPSWSR